MQSQLSREVPGGNLECPSRGCPCLPACWLLVQWSSAWSSQAAVQLLLVAGPRLLLRRLHRRSGAGPPRDPPRSPTSPPLLPLGPVMSEDTPSSEARAAQGSRHARLQQQDQPCSSSSNSSISSGSGPYSERPEWKDVVPILQDDGPDPPVPIRKPGLRLSASRDFARCSSVILCRVRADYYPPSALQSTPTSLSTL
jgi:hypothetical protein